MIADIALPSYPKDTSTSLNLSRLKSKTGIASPLFDPIVESFDSNFVGHIMKSNNITTKQTINKSIILGKGIDNINFTSVESLNEVQPQLNQKRDKNVEEWGLKPLLDPPAERDSTFINNIKQKMPNSDFFSSLTSRFDEKIVNNIFKNCYQQFVPEGGQLFEIGAKCDEFFVVLHGECSSYVKYGNNTDLTDITESIEIQKDIEFECTSEKLKSNYPGVPKYKKIHESRVSWKEDGKPYLFFRNNLMRCINNLTSGDTIGELSMLSSKSERTTVSVFCEEDTYFGVLDKKTYKSLVGKKKREEILIKINLIEEFPLFSNFPQMIKRDLINYLKPMTYIYSSIIIKEGQKVNSQLQLKNGSIKIVKTRTKDSVKLLQDCLFNKKIDKYQKVKYKGFGPVNIELALVVENQSMAEEHFLNDTDCNYSLIANSEKVLLYELDKKFLMQVLNSFPDLMKDFMGKSQVKQNFLNLRLNELSIAYDDYYVHEKNPDKMLSYVVRLPKDQPKDRGVNTQVKWSDKELKKCRSQIYDLNRKKNMVHSDRAGLTRGQVQNHFKAIDGDAHITNNRSEKVQENEKSDQSGDGQVLRRNSSVNYRDKTGSYGLVKKSSVLTKTGQINQFSLKGSVVMANEEADLDMNDKVRSIDKNSTINESSLRNLFIQHANRKGTTNITNNDYIFVTEASNTRKLPALENQQDNFYNDLVTKKISIPLTTNKKLYQGLLAEANSNKHMSLPNLSRSKVHCSNMLPSLEEGQVIKFDIHSTENETSLERTPKQQKLRQNLSSLETTNLSITDRTLFNEDLKEDPYFKGFKKHQKKPSKYDNQKTINVRMFRLTNRVVYEQKMSSLERAYKETKRSKMIKLKLDKERKLMNEEKKFTETSQLFTKLRELSKFNLHH